jgi:cysteine-rich secretory family protein
VTSTTFVIPSIWNWRRISGPVLGTAIALSSSAAGIDPSHADCSALYAAAQQHAYDMARRNSLDHAGFRRHRGPAGAVAENVAVGCETEECARRMWMQSPRHRANMMLGGCQAVASAVSASGRRYWTMAIGGGRGGAAGRDFSIEGDRAP